MRVQNISIYDKTVKKIEGQIEISIPGTFEREDLIHKILLTQEANSKQPQGRTIRAGLKHVVNPQRKKSARARTRKMRSGRAAEAPGTRGGRLAHRPRSEKNITLKQNKKERYLSLQHLLYQQFERKKILVLKEIREQKAKEFYEAIREVNNLPVLAFFENKEKVKHTYDISQFIAALLYLAKRKQQIVISEEIAQTIKEKYAL